MKRTLLLFVVLVIVATTTLIISIASSNSFVRASVMGIDFGVESIKIAAPKNNNMEIVLNEQSHRKSWNAVGFRSDERYFADEAKNLAARFPDNMFLGVNRLVGTQHNDTEAISWFRDTMNYKIKLEQFEGYDLNALHAASAKKSNENETEGEEKKEEEAAPAASNNQKYYGTDGTLQIRTGSNPDIAYSAEALTGMLFTYIKDTVYKDTRLKVTDAVVTIPAHFNVRQRQALIDAAEIAGIRVISLVHPTTASALLYGMNKRGFGEESVNVMILDIGAGHADAAVYTYKPTVANVDGKGKAKKIRNAEALGTIATRSIVSTREIGGRIFDSCLAKYIEDQFIAKNPKGQRVLGAETLQARKSVVSLMRAANKAKEMLSANRVAPIVVEGINKDKDFPITLKREEFETECAHIFDKIPALVKEAAKRAGIDDISSTSDLVSFEMFGGGSRVPKVIEDLSKLRGKTVDRTLNTDEAAALGAGFYAGAIAGRFRMKSFGVHEHLGCRDDPIAIPERNITFLLTPKPGSEKPPAFRTLYSAQSRLGAKKSVTVNRNEDNFGLYIYHSHASASDPELTHEKTRNLDRLVNVSGIHSALDSIFYYFATGDKDAAASTSTDEQQQQEAEVAAKPRRQLRHPNNTHSIRVDFRLTESGLVEVEQAELRATYIMNVTKKFKVNLTEEEIADLREKAKERVLVADEARKAALANKTANETNNSTTEDGGEKKTSEDAEKESSAEEEQQDSSSSSSDDDENNNSTSSASDENNSTAEGSEGETKEEEKAAGEGESDNATSKSSKKKKNNKKKKKVVNETEVLERKIRLAQKNVRTYRMESTQVEEARRRSVPLQVNTAYTWPTPLLPDDKRAAKKVLRALDDIDTMKRETAAAKNDLEAYIVWCKNEGILDNKELIKLGLLTPEVEKEVTEALTKTADWLEEDGAADDVAKAAFVEKLKELHVATGGVLTKYQELTAPPPKKKSSKKKSSKKKKTSSSTEQEEEGSTSGGDNNETSSSSGDKEDYSDYNKKDGEEESGEKKDDDSNSNNNEEEAEASKEKDL